MPSTDAAARTHRRRRPGRRARLRRPPHALRRAGAVGPGGHAVAAARRHDGDRRQLRVLDRAARRRARRLHPAHDGAGRGHVARRARRPGPAWDWRTLRRLPRPARRPPRGQRRLPRRPLDDAARRDGRRRDDARPPTPDQIAAMVAAAARVARRRRARLLVVARRGAHRRRRRAGAVARAPSATSSSRSPARCATTRARRSSSSPPWARSPPDRMELMADMSLAADRPLNWNLLGSLSPTEIYEQQLHVVRPRRGAGAPRSSRSRCPTSCACARAGCSSRCPGWQRGRRAARRRSGGARSRDPAVRARLRAGVADAARHGLAAMARFDLHRDRRRLRSTGRTRRRRRRRARRRTRRRAGRRRAARPACRSR